MPHCCIGVDVIVGFPGETEEEFQETYSFLEQLDISYLHVFTYSERENTLAVTLDGAVPISVRKERNQLLRNLSEQKLNNFMQQHAGEVRPVLFEHAEKDGCMEGYSDNYIKVSAPYNHEYINTIISYTL
jgi:threonylcarbamoyladenosine tRNA methylthiotransferase MtaB